MLNAVKMVVKMVVMHPLLRQILDPPLSYDTVLDKKRLPFLKGNQGQSYCLTGVVCLYV